MEVKVQMDVADQIIKVLDDLGKRFGVAIDWTKDNIMPYVQDLSQRIIKYEIGMSLLWMFIGLCFLIPGLIMGYKCIFKKELTDCDEDVFYVIVTVVLVIIGVIICYNQAADIIQAVYMPEKIWMKYIQENMPKLK